MIPNDEAQDRKVVPISALGTNVDNTLNERGKRYGTFKGHASIAQALKRAIHAAPKWSALSDSQKESLEMIMVKTARILNGDPNYADSWHDVAGYSKLVEDEINGIVR